MEFIGENHAVFESREDYENNKEELTWYGKPIVEEPVEFPCAMEEWQHGWCIDTIDDLRDWTILRIKELERELEEAKEDKKLLDKLLDL